MKILPKNDNQIAPKLISLDQKYICFDVELVSDAKQRLTISRSNAKRVAWRVRTNAPTRYIVNPNCGVLDDTTLTQTFQVELVNNRYNPQHKLVVQAIQLLDSESSKTIWKSERTKNPEFVQTINLELSTTLMNLESTHLLNEINSQCSASLQSLLDQSSTTGEARVKELESLCQMLKFDIDKLETNVDKTKKLTETLQAHLDNRKQTNKDLTSKIETIEPKYTALAQKVRTQEASLLEVQAKNKSEQNCSVM